MCVMPLPVFYISIFSSHCLFYFLCVCASTVWYVALWLLYDAIVSQACFCLCAIHIYESKIDLRHWICSIANCVYTCIGNICSNQYITTHRIQWNNGILLGFCFISADRKHLCDLFHILIHLCRQSSAPIKCCCGCWSCSKYSTVITMAFEPTFFLLDLIRLRLCLCVCDLFCFCYSFNIVLSQWMLHAQLSYLWCCNVTFHNGTTGIVHYYCLYCNWTDFISHRIQSTQQFHPESMVFFSTHHQSTKPLTSFERIKTKHFFVYVLRLSDAVHLTRQLNVISVLHYYYYIGMIRSFLLYWCWLEIGQSLQVNCNKIHVPISDESESITFQFTGFFCFINTLWH